MAGSVTKEEQEIITKLTKSWVWISDWIDNSAENTAGRLVEFQRKFQFGSTPKEALLHFSADTRYKLLVNGQRIAVGPTRGSPVAWYYDSLDIAPYLFKGENEIKFVVIRYWGASRAAMPFTRTAYPGLAVVGAVTEGSDTVELGTMSEGWVAHRNDNVLFPTGLIDDAFLHINERGTVGAELKSCKLVPYNTKTLNGELAPWRLRPRGLPMPEESKSVVEVVKFAESSVSISDWESFLKSGTKVILPANSTHKLELQAEVHSTAFLRWTFEASTASTINLKALYSEGYEQEPRAYPFFRTKDDRLDEQKGKLIGPADEVTIRLDKGTATYEPFWFRTYRMIQLTLTVGPTPVDLVAFDATQVNYPMGVKGYLKNESDSDATGIWDVSVRTMRNCMFDAYVDCPFYEQLSYIGDSRTVGLFHYLISGDDQLMRRTIDNFSASFTLDGLPQSRFPSQVPQIIAGFALYWILMVSDHHLYFGDTPYAKQFISKIDGVLGFFEAHVNEQGLVAGISEDIWQFVDWVTTWGATETHLDKGVPTSGRGKNLHTYFTLLYAYVLRSAADFVQDLGRSGVADEYRARADSLAAAARKYCFDGQFFTDSTADMADDLAYSQHCQVFAVLAGAADALDARALLEKSFKEPKHSKCSYMMMFYAFRAFASAGDEAYNALWQTAWDPWRNMLTKNLTTWEEDDVRQRSDCHAWGSVPLYEYCTELAGIQPTSPGCTGILFAPRIQLSPNVETKVMLGRDNSALVTWSKDSEGVTTVQLRLEKAIKVSSRLPQGQKRDHGVVSSVELSYRE